MRGLGLTVAFAVALIADPLNSQQPESVGSRWDLPADVAGDVVRRLNDPTVDLREGNSALEAGERVTSELAVLDGDLSLGGEVIGDVLVVNGDVSLLPGSSITGDLLVIGGAVESSPTARVTGEIASYSAPLAYERMAGRVRWLRAPRGAPRPITRRGFSDFLITTGKSYNRVEGMPIAFGPRFETESSNPFRVEALGIYRSEQGLTLDPERMGYFVRGQQFIGGHRDYSVGGTLYSVVDPIEEWQLSDLETGLATFVFHRDYRDHYERQGGSVFAGWEPTSSPYRVQVEARWETHDTRAVGSPWSLFRNAEAWRPQPIIAEGRMASVVAEADYDTRSDSGNPAAGWFVQGRVEQAFDVQLVQPALAPVDPTAVGPVATAKSYGNFLTGLVDLRRYNRINAASRFNVRLVAGGALDGNPLPPQRQHALGGEGSLPGYLHFRADCGARSREVLLTGFPEEADVGYFPNYGCDAFTLLQAEFRGKLAFRFRWDGGPWSDERDEGDRVWDFGWDMAPDWALFVDAGRGWAFDPTRPDVGTHVDVGAGVLLERIGLYFAVPVNGGSGVNVFMRIGPRF